MPDEDKSTLRNILDMMGMKRAEQAPFTELFVSQAPAPEAAAAAADKPSAVANTAQQAVNAAKSAGTAVKSGIISVKRKANVDRLLRRFKQDKKDEATKEAPPPK